MTAEELIRTLGLQPHPKEGGYFVETYRSGGEIPQALLGADYSGPRAYSTAIYFLLTPDTFSAMHRLPTDEIFHFYLGDPVEMLQLHPGGVVVRETLGADLGAGLRPQLLVPGGVWQGSQLCEGGRFALMGTTVAPGFDFDDYETGRRETLIAAYPEAHEMIVALTHR